MPNIHIENTGKTLEVENESNILRNSLRFGGEVPNKCGGGFCGTCVVKVEEGYENLDKIKPAEEKKLGELLDQNYRLACQTFVSGDIKISWDWEFTKLVKKRKVSIKS